MRNSYAYKYDNFKARKKYRCYVCHGIIEKGQRYQKEEYGFKCHYDPECPKVKN
jgi:hypothetical protein